MYVKNIQQLIKEQIPLKLKLSEGTSIYGKIISQDGKNGFIKLYDGTIIPSIFLSENKLVTDRFVKFLIEQFDSNGLHLSVIDDTLEFQGEDSINSLISKLNIPKEEGTKIINSLIRFNLPATDENIMTIYKNITFLDNLSRMKDNDILSFLNNYIEGDFTEDSKEFSIAKNIFSKLMKIDTDFLSLLIENDIPYNVNSMLKSSNFLESKFNINSIINALKNLLDTSVDMTAANSFTDIIKELINQPEILPLLYDYLEGKLFPGGEKHTSAEEAINSFSKMNTDYLLSLIQRKLPDILKGKPEASSILNNNTGFTNIINELRNLLKENSTELFLASFKDIIKELAEKPEFLLLARNYLNGNQAVDSDGFRMVQESFSKASSISADSISSLLKNKIQAILEGIVNSSELSKDTLNMDKIINSLKSILENNDKDLSLVSLNNTLKELLDKPEVLNLLPDSLVNRFTDDLEILKLLSNNYNIYFFNSYENDKIFKNNIIIKNRYKANSSINPDDVKVFITVDTPNIGVIESYLYKKGTSLTISIKSEEKYIGLFKRSIGFLNKNLEDKGYNVINISVGSINPETNLVSLSNFFNDNIFKELDVRV